MNNDNKVIEGKITDSQKRIEARKANPEWQSICAATKQLRDTPCGKALAQKLIQDFLAREKQNIRQ